MTAGSDLARFTIGSDPQAGDEERSANAFDVGVHIKLGERLEGLEVFDDGITFRSPVSIQGGRIIELVLCKGAVLVDAMVVGCVPLRDESGGYAIRARYHKTSHALNELIREELAREIDRAP